MIRNLRNFWARVEIDGQSTVLRGGPRSKDGGFDATLYVRDHGACVKGLDITGRANPDGTLTLRVWRPDGTLLDEQTYQR